MSKQDESPEKHFAAFKVEAEEQLRAISSGLRALEREPSPEKRACLLETIYQQTCSMNRAARAVLRDFEATCQSMENVLARLKVLRDVEAIYQSMEKLLARIKKGDLMTTPDLFDVLYRAVDAIGDLLANPRKKKTLDISSLLKDLSYLEGGGN